MSRQYMNLFYKVCLGAASFLDDWCYPCGQVALSSWTSAVFKVEYTLVAVVSLIVVGHGFTQNKLTQEQLAIHATELGVPLLRPR